MSCCLRMCLVVASLSAALPARAAVGGDADIPYTRGVLALERGDCALAERCFARALELRPSDPDALLRRAAALNRLGRHREASEALAEAGRIDPRLPGLSLERGYALVGQGRCREALPCLEGALAAEPANGLAEYLKGIALAGAGEHGRALDSLARAAASVPSLAPSASYQSALSEMALGREEEARVRLERLAAGEDTAVAQAARALLGGPPKRWWVYTTARYEYDSNAVLLPDNAALVEPTIKDDFRFLNTFELNVTPLARERYDLSVDYRFAQSVHNQIGDFNLQGHELAPALTFDLGRGARLAAGYEFDYYVLDDWHQDYYRTHAVFSGIDFATSRHLLHRLSYRYTTGDYFLAYEIPEDNLDILNEHTVSLDQYLFLGGDSSRFFRFSLSWDRNDTAGSNFFYNGYAFLWELSTPVVEEVRFDAWIRYLALDFQRSAAGRFDNRQEYNVMLLRPLNRYLDVAFNYGAMINGSNVPLYRFRRNIFSLIVACHF